MISRLFPAVRRCIGLVTSQRLPPVVNAQMCKYPEPAGVIIYREMSSDEDVLNDPKRHLDYNGLINKKKDSRTVLIDVREDSEIQQTGKLPGSIHIPLSELKKALRDMTPEEFKKRYNADKPRMDAPLIFSCRSGRRSLAALKDAITMGYKNAAHYKGGWLDWVSNVAKNKQ